MDAFLTTMLSPPTVVFTVPLLLSLVYWLIAAIGLLDLDILDGALDGVDGALDGVDGALDGAADGAADAAVDGALDADAPDAPHITGLGRLADAFHLGRIPLTITLSVWTLTAWLSSYGLSVLLRGSLGAMAGSAGEVGAVVASAIAGAVITPWVTRPMLPAFQVHGARNLRSLVGETCEITTGRVDSGFGQAEVRAGSDHLLVQVRCDLSSNGLRRGEQALLVSYDARREAFVVEPLAAARANDTRAIRSASGSPSVRSPSASASEVTS